MEKEPESKQLMERSKISDEELLRLAIKLEALLIRCNFSGNLASYIVECSGSRIHYIN